MCLIALINFRLPHHLWRGWVFYGKRVPSHSGEGTRNWFSVYVKRIYLTIPEPRVKLM